MKSIFDELSKLSWMDLLNIILHFMGHEPKKYVDNSSILRDFKSEFDCLDIERSIPDIYKLLFRYENQEILSVEIKKMLMKLKDEANSPQHQVFDEIESIQQIISTAMWRYKIQLLPYLENFAKEFDRIDDDRERYRKLREYQK